jgi:hypothetical protein
MLRGAPPAAGPTGTVGRARATPELHGAVRSGTAGRGLNRGHQPCRATRRRMRISAPPAARPFLGSRAVRGPEDCSTRSGKLRVVVCMPRLRRPRDHSWDCGLRAGRRSCATRSGPTRLRMPTLAPQAAGPARGPRAASGPEELRDSEWSHGCRRDTVTVCLSISSTAGHV